MIKCFLSSQIKYVNRIYTTDDVKMSLRGLIIVPFMWNLCECYYVITWTYVMKNIERIIVRGSVIGSDISDNKRQAVGRDEWWMNEDKLIVIPVSWFAAPRWTAVWFIRSKRLTQWGMIVSPYSEVDCWDTPPPIPHCGGPSWSQVWRSWTTKASWPVACPQLNMLLAWAADQLQKILHYSLHYTHTVLVVTLTLTLGTVFQFWAPGILEPLRYQVTEWRNKEFSSEYHKVTNKQIFCALYLLFWKKNLSHKVPFFKF